MFGQILKAGLFFFFALFTVYIITAIASPILDDIDDPTSGYYIEGFSSLVTLVKIFFLIFSILIVVGLPILIVLDTPKEA